MIATTFGLFGGLGGSVALLTVLAYESYSVHRLLRRFGLIGIAILGAAFSALGWSFMTYGRPWMLYHFGEVGYWIGVATVAAPTCLFLLQALPYLYRLYLRMFSFLLAQR